MTKRNKKDTFYIMKLKISFFKKHIIKFIKTYFVLPHIWISIIISFLSIITLYISIYYQSVDGLISSIFANIFAGLVTGLVISIISLTKGISLYRTKCEIEWLNDINKQCLQFFKESNKVYFSKESTYSSNEEKYDAIYDLASLGNSISVNISQSQFKQNIPFNPYKFFKHHFNFDAVEEQKKNEVLRENIMDLDINNLDNKIIREMFNDMEKSIRTLNYDVLDKIHILEIKIKAINIT